MDANTKMKIVYVITQRSGKSYWNRIGVAFVNQDGSLNVRLEAVPVTGEMQIRDYVPKDEFSAPSPRLDPGNGRSHGPGEDFADLA